LPSQKITKIPPKKQIEISYFNYLNVYKQKLLKVSSPGKLFLDYSRKILVFVDFDERFKRGNLAQKRFGFMIS